MDPEELAKRFEYHPPSGEAKELHGFVRLRTRTLAEDINHMVPTQSREMALFWTHFEQASFWLHAHIARNMPHEEE